MNSYLLLFFDSFESAFILTPQSESAIYAMVIFKEYNSYLIFIIASSASILGSIVNWWIGKKLIFLKQSRIFKHRTKEIEHAEKKWNQFVVWTLLFSFIKIIGNPFALLAGFLNTRFNKFLLLITVGKLVYYLSIIINN